MEKGEGPMGGEMTAVGVANETVYYIVEKYKDRMRPRSEAREDAVLYVCSQLGGQLSDLLFHGLDDAKDRTLFSKLRKYNPTRATLKWYEDK